MSKTFRVGEYLVEADLNRISGPDTDEQIEPRSMEVLVYLAEHAGEVVAKEQLIRAVWKDTFVADGALWQGISRLREVFRDDPKAPSYIQTVPRRGYVLIADVRPQSEAPRYQVLKKLGQGAMGEVFLAEDSLLHRRVALKFIWFWTDEPTPSQYELVIENGINQHHFRSSIALSPDGRRVVFKSGPGPLYVRNLDDRGEAPLRDSEGGNSPFFSPDGEWVAFFADRKLKKVSISGGSAEILCDLFGNVLGGTWGPDQTIVIADSNTLWQVPASGGTRQRLSMLEEDGREDSHWNPSFLPDGSGVLFTVFSEPAASRLAILDLGSGEHRELLNNVTRAIYVSTGHLVYTRGDGLYGIPFDLGTHSITGSEVPLVQDILVTPANVGQFGVSVGTLAYVPGRWSLSELVRVGLDGQLLESFPLRPGLFSK